MYSTQPWPRALLGIPLRGILTPYQTDKVFLIFSFPLSRRLGKQKSIAPGRRSSRLVNYRVWAANTALQHRGLGMRDLGRGIRDTGVAGSLRVRDLRSGVFTAPACSPQWKITAAMERGMAGERKTRERQIRQTERQRGTLRCQWCIDKQPKTCETCTARCARLSCTLCITGMMSNKPLMFLFCFSPPGSQMGKWFISLRLFRTWQHRQINMHRPICQYAISAGN